MERIAKFSNKLSDMFIFRVLRRGMTMLIPMVLVSSIALAIICFPIPGFENVLKAFLGGLIYNVLTYVKDFSFSYFSVMLSVTMSMSYVMEKKVAREILIFAPVASCISFLLIARPMGGDGSANLSTQGSFLAMLVSLAVSALYIRLAGSKLGKIWKISAGHDVVYKSAMSAVPVLLVIIGIAAFCSFVIYDVFKITNLTKWFGVFFDNIVESMNSDFFEAAACAIIIHGLWFFGIHGSNAIENVLQEHLAVGSSIIFSKTFFDCFVLMGGCGTSVCILLAIMFYSKHAKLKNLACSAALPVFLNINEIITFGLPIVWNPIMLIPFMLVPLECTVIAYAAVRFGIVPPVISEVTWTTPVFISGYIATGSLMGSILQLVNITVGTLTYMPFLRAYEAYDLKRNKALINEITEVLRRSALDGDDAALLDRTDIIGVTANSLMSDLRDAVAARQLYFHYQPQFKADGTCIGAEALIRWKHPTVGFVYPPLIIYLAKKGGFLPELEKQIFEMACFAMKRIAASCGKQYKLSVNITASSLKWDGLEECISSNIQKYDVSPEYLWIEITEEDIISTDNKITDKINRLRAQGHEFLIDDFGMGRTSILYLQTALFDGVKIDGSLTKTILSSNTSREIVSSVIDLGSKLGVKVVAEYVETKDECELLDKLGCDIYQGYYFSRPISLDKYIEILNKN